MRAVLLGPSDVSKAWRYGKVGKDGLERHICRMGAALARCFEGVAVIPDDGMPLEVGKAYTRHSGRKPIGLYPDGDISRLEPNFCHVEPVHMEGSWPDLNYSLTRQANPIICLGYSPGVMAEIGFIKYHQKNGKKEGSWMADLHLLVDLAGCGSRLPPYMGEELDNVFYFSGPDGLVPLVENKRDIFKTLLPGSRF